jgi:hypothetical protein
VNQLLQIARSSYWQCLRHDLAKRALLFLIACAPALVALRAQMTHWVNLPISDEWDSPGITLLHYAQHRLTWNDLWAQHNETRLVVPKLIHLALASIADWDVRQGMLITFISVCLASAAAFFYLYRRCLTITASLLIWWLFINLVLFAPSQYENLLCGFVFEIYLPFLCAFGCLAVNLGNMSFPIKVSANAVLALVASYSFSHGLLLWVIGAPIPSHPRLPRQRTLAFCYIAYLVIAIAAVCFYFMGYKHPPVAPPSASLGQLPQILDFLTVWWGGVLRSNCMNARVVGASVLLLALPIVLTAIIKTIRMPASWRNYYPWLALVAFAGGAGLLTAIGRVNLGTDLVFNRSFNLFSGMRYNVTAAFFYVAIIGLSFNLYADWGCLRPHWQNRLLAGTIFCSTLLALAWTYTFLEERMRLPLFKQNREHARTAIKWITALPQNPDISLAYPYPDGFWARVVEMRRYGVIHLPLAGKELRQAISSSPHSDTVAAGNLDFLAVKPNRQCRIAGWTRNPTTNRPAEYVVLGWEQTDGVFHPFTALPTGRVRSDVARVLGISSMKLAGFDESLDCSKLPENAEIKGWAVDFDHQQVFPMGGRLRLRN